MRYELTPDGFQKMCVRTGGKLEMLELELARGGLGIAGEAGEVADHIKKLLFHGVVQNEDELEKLATEMGDVLWYIAVLAHDLEFPLSYVMWKVTQKLEKRYPNGFNHAEAQAPDKHAHDEDVKLGGISPSND